ncbi:lamin tail domain-containing protein [Paractinoplanes brasiliensis]|uniref:Lamin tail-like protein n=1 Tax=Paractinoplanes brasiliensis TaxID=52695 RepID=A0A4R6JZT8_9ACTN|nr:lamin tail domain-containing protein [Actinoplanes brasiliensis]TDO40365.1 lamin tail-like protein [Actinoplanes brasiliensis]
MISRLVTKAALIGVAATFAIAAPASAAATPTLSGPEEVKGYNQFTMTGTADPNTTVQLYETAIGWNDMQPAVNYDAGGGPVTATADSEGRFTIRRWLDSGFYFEVRQGSVASNRITVYSRVEVTFWVTSNAVGTLVAQGSVHPGQPGLPVRIEKQSASGAWTSVATTTTDEDAAFSRTFTGLARGEHTYRAYVGPDNTQGVRADYSNAHTTWVDGTTTPTTPPATTKPPTTPPVTTPPTTKPPTTAPTTKPPATTKPPTTPAVGAIQFTRIQYDAPGTDTGSNGSLNTEWVKLTNKTKAAINLNGWTVRDQQNIVYKFPSVSLGAGKSIFVLSGKGTNTTTHRYWGRAGVKGYVWNNGGETAYLRNAANTTIDSCTWKTVSPGYSNC